MHVARFLRARLALQHSDKWRLTLDQTLQCGLHIIQMLRTEHPLSSPTKLARSLRPPQQEYTQNRSFAAREIEDLLNAMFVLRHSTVSTAGRTCEPMALQCIKSLTHGVFVKIHHRLAIVLLIARIHQRVQRKRIVIRRSDFFFRSEEHTSELQSLR